MTVPVPNHCINTTLLRLDMPLKANPENHQFTESRTCIQCGTAFIEKIALFGYGIYCFTHSDAFVNIFFLILSILHKAGIGSREFFFLISWSVKYLNILPSFLQQQYSQNVYAGLISIYENRFSIIVIHNPLFNLDCLLLEFFKKSKIIDPP